MKVGLLGPTNDETAFRNAVTFLFHDADAEQVVYLGDRRFAETTLERWLSELQLDDPARFLDRALDVAVLGAVEPIEQFLADDVRGRRLRDVRGLPAPPARAVEFLDDRVILMVHDKAILDEDDIANSHLIVYGLSKESQFHRFGRRAFFTPGPLQRGRVGLLETGEDGVSLALFELSGTPVFREALHGGATKLTVSS